LSLGIPVVIAKSFARIFYRNAFNQALGLLEADICDAVSAGETIEVDLATGLIKTARAEVQALPIPPFMLELISEGGLINHLRRQLEERK
jgi:3-isopropylmalate/(R)-2-methylmalate dehydratase small subunit